MKKSPASLAFAGDLYYNITWEKGRNTGTENERSGKMEGKDLTAIAGSDFLARQQMLDVEKWLASERAGRDLCGTLSFCGFCVKGETNPCAKAEFRYKMREALEELGSEAAAADGSSAESGPTAETRSEIEEECAEEIAAEMLADESEGEEVSPRRAAEEIMSDSPVRQSAAEAGPKGAQALPAGYEEVTRYRRSFKARLIQNEKAQDFYTELKNALAGLSGIRSRMCQGCENFRIGKNKVAKLNIGGKTLVLYLALDPADYEDSKYRFSDVSDRRSYAETPMKLRITGVRAVKHAKELISALAEKFEVANVGCIYMDYHFPYRTDEQLISKGLIKPYKAIVKKKN